MKKEILSWVKTIILAVLLAFVVDMVFIVNATVPTGSMENTIMAGDRILALRTRYWFSDPAVSYTHLTLPTKAEV